MTELYRHRVRRPSSRQSTPVRLPGDANKPPLANPGTLLGALEGTGRNSDSVGIHRDYTEANNRFSWHPGCARYFRNYRSYSLTMAARMARSVVTSVAKDPVL